LSAIVPTAARGELGTLAAPILCNACETAVICTNVMMSYDLVHMCHERACRPCDHERADRPFDRPVGCVYATQHLGCVCRAISWHASWCRVDHLIYKLQFGGNAVPRL